MIGDPGFSDGVMNMRLNALRERLARLSTSVPTSAVSRPSSSASQILLEERRRNDLLQQLREEYSKPRVAPAATPLMPPQYFMPAPESKPKSSRLTEIMESMLLQNAQVFQMMQQQQLMNSMNRPQSVPVPLPAPVAGPAVLPAALPPLPAPVAQPTIPPELPPLRAPFARPLRELRRYPFPGPPYLRRLRHLSYAAFFIESLRAALTKGKKIGTGVLHIPDDFLMDLYLKEIISACHNIYLDPRGPVYRLMDDFIIRGNYDYHLLVAIPKPLPAVEEQRFYEALAYFLETVVYYITDIMPNRGVLGTHRKAAIFEIMKEYRLFPKGYLFATERQLLTFDERGRTFRVNDGQAMMFIVGLFFVRALATTLMLRPLRYNLVGNKTVVDQVVDTNMRFIATLVVFLYRVVMRDGEKRVMPLPKEIAPELYTDSEMLFAFQKLKPTFDKCERYITQWAQEYVRRLRAAAFTFPNGRRFERNFYRRAAIQPIHDFPDAPAFDRQTLPVRIRPPDVPPYPRNFNSVVIRPSQNPFTTN